VPAHASGPESPSRPLSVSRESFISLLGAYVKVSWLARLALCMPLRAASSALRYVLLPCCSATGGPGSQHAYVLVTLQVTVVLLTTLPFALAAASTIVNAWHSKRTGAILARFGLMFL